MRLRWGETLERVLWASWAALGLLARPRAAGELGRALGRARPRWAEEEENFSYYFPGAILMHIF